MRLRVLGCVLAALLFGTRAGGVAAAPSPNELLPCKGPFKSSAPEVSPELQRQARALITFRVYEVRTSREQRIALERAVALDPHFEDGWMGLSYSADARGDSAASVAALCELIAMGVPVWKSLGWQLATSNRGLEAAVAYRKQLARVPSDTDLYRLLGHALWGGGDRAGAIDAFAMGAAKWGDDAANRGYMVGYVNDVRKELKQRPLSEAEVLAMARGEAPPAKVVAPTPAPTRPSAVAKTTAPAAESAAALLSEAGCVSDVKAFADQVMNRIGESGRALVVEINRIRATTYSSNEARQQDICVNYGRHVTNLQGVDREIGGFLERHGSCSSTYLDPVRGLSESIHKVQRDAQQNCP